MIECRKCRTVNDRKQCGGRDYYSYWDIKFCVWQVQWIISQFLGLDDDEIYIKNIDWPPDPSGKPDTNFDPRSKRVNTEAAFCKPMEILGEVNNRLAATGRSGKRLIASVLRGESIEEMDGETRNALYYVSGWRRRGQPYFQWVRR